MRPRPSCRGLTSAESRCLRVSRVLPRSVQSVNLAPRASISERIPWWYFCRSSTDETSLMEKNGGGCGSEINRNRKTFYLPLLARTGTARLLHHWHLDRTLTDIFWAQTSVCCFLIKQNLILRSVLTVNLLMWINKEWNWRNIFFHLFFSIILFSLNNIKNPLLYKNMPKLSTNTFIYFFQLIKCFFYLLTKIMTLLFL